MCAHLFGYAIYTWPYTYFMSRKWKYILVMHFEALIYYFFVLLFCNCLKNFDNSYKVCTQSHSWYVHTVTQLTQSMCEECKTTQWSKNWPHLWLMAYEISSGIFSNMPMYQPLHSTFVVILLATLMMIKKQSKIMPSSSWLSTERVSSVTEKTHTHFCWFFFNFPAGTYLLIGNSL